MKEPDDIFQSISIRRKVIISIGMLMVLITVIGFYGLVGIVESQKRLHESVIEGQKMARAIDIARLSQVHFKKQVQEWKNILLRGQEKNLFNKYLKAFNEEERKTNDYLKSLLQITSQDSINIPRITNAISLHDKLGKEYHEALAKYESLDLKNASRIDKSLCGIDRDLTDEIDVIVSVIKNVAEQKLKETELIAKTRMEAYYAMSFVIIFLMITAVCFGIFNILSIIKNLPLENSENRPDTKKISSDF